MKDIEFVGLVMVVFWPAVGLIALAALLRIACAVS